MLLEASLKLEHYLDIDITSKTYYEFYESVFICDTTFTVNASAEGLSFDIYEVKNMYLTTQAEMDKEDDSTETVNLELDLNDFVKEIEITRIDSNSNLLQLSEVDINLDEKKIKISFSL